MKEIKVFIRKKMLTRVVNELQRNGYCCTAIINCRGTGKLTDPTREDYPVRQLTPYLSNLVSKIEIVCKQKDVENIISIIQSIAGTGEKGDGMIYISEVEEVIRIRDGMRGEEIVN